MRAAIYARVSTFDQEPENQLQELRRYIQARGWTATEFVDRGVSGSKERRPALDSLVADARKRRFDVVVAWRLDRLGRNLQHLRGKAAVVPMNVPEWSRISHSPSKTHKGVLRPSSRAML